MSVLFTSISETNPIKIEHIEETLATLNLSLPEDEKPQYYKLLAALQDSVDILEALPDYQPPVDVSRFPRKNVHRPSKDENVLDSAWAHTFSIRDESLTDGLLFGKTISVKDCICVAGVPQLLGTDIWEPWTPEIDATVVTRSLEAGGEIVGTGMCENLCQSTAGCSSSYGNVDNPFAKGYAAGGSTSGTAALVGGGFVDLGIGADQGGSIRVPAAHCGCIGLKPTFGLVPYTGIASNDAVNDHAGPLARTVEDCARLLEAIAGYDGIDDRQLGAPPTGERKYLNELLQAKDKGISDMKIGILRDGFEMKIVDPTMKAAVLAAAERFKELGATVEEVSMPFHVTGNAIWTGQQRIAGAANLLGRAYGRRGLNLPELSKRMSSWTQGGFMRAFPTTRNILLNGIYLEKAHPGLYGKCVNLIRRLSDEYDALFEKYDVMILPITSFVAPRYGDDQFSNDPLVRIGPTVGLTANTVQFDATGHPAMSLPIGFLPAKEDGTIMLPVGMQIVAAKWREDKIFRAAHAWEMAFDWKEHRYDSL